jgi:hypothetical protein
MPTDYIDPVKFAALLALDSPRVCELVRVSWPAPDGDIYYASSQYDELLGYESLAARNLTIETRFSGERFQDVAFSSGIGDEKVDLDFADTDGAVRALYAQHGPGLRVEVFYYFPEIDWMPSVWWGHLQPPEGADATTFKCKAAAGFRSGQLPLPRRAFYRTCQAVFGGKLDSLPVIAQNDCPYNRHLGGVVGNLDGDGNPYTDCPRHTRAVCIERLEPPGATRAPQMLSFDTVVETVYNGQTKGATLFPRSRGNENNLKRPLRVVFGRRTVRDLDLLAFIRFTNTNHPDKGFVNCLFAVSEGRIRSMLDCRINDAPVKIEHLQRRLGALRQAPTGITPNGSNYSGTAHFLGLYGQVNPADYGPSNLQGSCVVEGLDQIRVYTDPETYVETYTTNRAWGLLETLRNRRWGYGLDDARFYIEDWIDLAAWCDETVAYSNPQGELFVGTRSTFNAELSERTAQQQVNDICLAGRFGLPFQQAGKLRVIPLAKEEDLEACPVFTDEGEDRNIVRDSKTRKSSLTFSQKSDAEMPNRVVVTFDDASQNHAERPLTFEDIDAQLRAGRAFGDHTQRVVEKKFSLLGVTQYGEAVRLGNLLLDLGQFDEGGLRNNLSIKFTTWFKFAINLHRYKVIHVPVAMLEPFGFEYFRIQTIKRKRDLKVEITAQAYPVDYYEQMEDLEAPPPIPGGEEFPNPGGRPGGRPAPIGLTELDFTNDRIQFRIEAYV